MAVWETPEALSGPSPTTPAGTPQPTYLGLGLIHTGLVTLDWALNFRYMNIPFNHVFFHSSNMPYDCSRETVTRSLLTHNPEYIFFLDTDVIPPRDVVPQLIGLSQQQNKPLISGLYWAKKHEETPMPAAWMKLGENIDEGRITYKSLENEIKPYLDKNALVEVDVVGAGCLLIKADIFKKLDESNPKAMFWEWGLLRKYPDGKPMKQISEDFWFCERVSKELGIKPHLATAVKCDHLLCPTGRRRALDGKLVL